MLPHRKANFLAVPNFPCSIFFSPCSGFFLLCGQGRENFLPCPFTFLSPASGTVGNSKLLCIVISNYAPMQSIFIPALLRPPVLKVLSSRFFRSLRFALLVLYSQVCVHWARKKKEIWMECKRIGSYFLGGLNFGPNASWVGVANTVGNCGLGIDFLVACVGMVANAKGTQIGAIVCVCMCIC